MLYCSQAICEAISICVVFVLSCMSGEMINFHLLMGEASYSYYSGTLSNRYNYYVCICNAGALGHAKEISDFLSPPVHTLHAAWTFDIEQTPSWE